MSEPDPITSLALGRRPLASAGSGGFSATITSYDTILARAFALAESGRFASLATLKQQLKAEGFVAVDTALRGIHDRRHLRALCHAAARVRAPD